MGREGGLRLVHNNYYTPNQSTRNYIAYTDVHNKLLGGKPVTISVAPSIVPACLKYGDAKVGVSSGLRQKHIHEKGKKMSSVTYHSMQLSKNVPSASWSSLPPAALSITAAAAVAASAPSAFAAAAPQASPTPAPAVLD